MLMIAITIVKCLLYSAYFLENLIAYTLVWHRHEQEHGLESLGGIFPLANNQTKENNFDYLEIGNLTKYVC